MGLQVSYSSLNTYKDCGYRFWLDKVKKIRPTTTSSAFLFGSALDCVFENMLKDFPNLKTVHDYNHIFATVFATTKINGEEVTVYGSPRINFSKADLQPELIDMNDEGYAIANELYALKSAKKDIPEELKIQYNILAMNSILAKSKFLIPEMLQWVKDNVVMPISTQQWITISNDDGDTFRGALDAVIETKRGIILYDLKTSSSPNQDYPDGCADTSPQLSIYSQEVNIKNVGYLVFDKNIRKREPRVRVREVYGTITEEQLDKTFKDIDDTLKLIKQKEFPRNLDSCNKYGGCPYAGYCHKNKSMVGLTQLEEK
jgi:hypothetical protein